MIITKYNKMLDSIITVANETSAYPKDNMLSEALVEATLISSYTLVGGILSSVTGSKILVVKVSDNVTSLKIEGGTPPFLNNIATITTKYDGFFIYDLGVSSDDYYQLTPSGTGDLFFNWLYVGEYLEFPDLNIGSYPEIVKENITNETSSGQVYTTSGVAHYEQEVSFSNIDRDDYLVFEDWYKSVSSSYNQLFYQYNSRLDDYPPFYCSITEFQPTSRSRDYYDFKITIREAK